MTESGLMAELEFYMEHQDEFVEKYDGKVIVLKNREVLGIYDTVGQARDETMKSHAPGTYQIQRVSPGDEAYTAVIPFIQVDSSHRTATE